MAASGCVKLAFYPTSWRAQHETTPTTDQWIESCDHKGVSGMQGPASMPMHELRAAINCAVARRYVETSRYILHTATCGKVSLLMLESAPRRRPSHRRRSAGQHTREAAPSQPQVLQSGDHGFSVPCLVRVAASGCVKLALYSFEPPEQFPSSCIRSPLF